MKWIRWIALVLPYLLVGCLDTFIGSPTEPGVHIPGSGVLATQSRPVSLFDSVVLAVPGELIVERTGNESLTITAEENLIDYLTSEVIGGRLVLGSRSHAALAPSWPILYRLTCRDLQSVTVSRAGKVEASALRSPQITFTISGAGEVRASGEVTHQSLVLSGAGRYLAAGVDSEKASITLSGAGRATLRASKRIEGIISGSGVLEYYGDPEIAVSVSGSGTIRRLGD